MSSTFRLFRAPLSEASDARENVECSFCGEHTEVGFEIGIGSDVITQCASCGMEVALDADDREAVACTRCSSEVSFPSDSDDLVACPACLAQGRVAIAKDTELGMVRWVDARDGWTHGLPGFRSTEWPTSAPNENGWVRVQVPQEHLNALVRTPTYPTIQGDRWLFCCREPMAFIGEWSRERFVREAADGDGQSLFHSIVDDVVPGLWEDLLHDMTGIYVFECSRCGRRRGHWDIA